MSIRMTLKRTVVVAASAIAIILGISSPAMAANTVLVLVASSQSDYGSMTHIDKGDNFKVCDSRADKYSVIGKVYKWNSYTRNWDFKFAEKDGGDAGCDYHKFNVTGPQHKMVLCWNGPGLHCATKYFHE